MVLRRSVAARLAVALFGVLAVLVFVAVGVATFAVRTPGVLQSPSIFPGYRYLGRELAPHLGDPEALRARAEQLADGFGSDVTVVTLEGQVLAAAGPPVPLPREAQLAASAQEVTFLSWSPQTLGVPVADGGGTRAVALVQVRPGPWSPVPLRPLLVLGVGQLVLLFLVVPIARSITRPLRQLATTAEDFGRGNLSARSGIQREDEVGLLARSFDQMAERLESQRRREREVMAHVSHELRTPLARVRMVLGLLETEDPQVERRLVQLEEELTGLEELVGHVLDASRLHLESLPLHPTPLDVKSLLERAVERLRAVAPEREVQVEVPEGLTMNADGALLERILDNLLDNARKYDASGQPLRVEAVAERERVCLRVLDRGPGIPPADRERIFEPFYRAAEVRGTTAGFGLGLPFARRVARAHGGDLQAHERPGGGTCMEVVFPARGRAAQ